MTTPSIGRMVRWARKRAGMTQQDLAHAIRVPQPTIGATGDVLAVEPSGPTVDREAIRRQLALDVPKRTWRALGRAAAKRQTSPTRMLRRLTRAWGAFRPGR